MKKSGLFLTVFLITISAPGFTLAAIDYTNWQLQEPSGSGTSPTIISGSQMNAGYSDVYFYTASDGGQVFMDTATGINTSGSVHPRCEMREMSGGSGAAWAPTQTNIETVTGQVLMLGDGTSGHTTIGQVFNSTLDIPLCEFQYVASVGGFEALYEEAKGAGTMVNLSTACALNTKYTFVLSLSNNLLTITINGVQVYSHAPSAAILTDQFYFKCGDYDQTAVTGAVSTTPYTEVEDYGVTVYHGSGTPTFTPTTAAATRTFTASPTPTESPTRTYTSTSTATKSPTGTATRTPTITATPTSSSTATFSFTATAAKTFTPTRTNTATSTYSSTATYTSSNTPTFTFSPTRTPVITTTATSTLSATAVLTSTATPPHTPTFTLSATPTNTLVKTNTPVNTATPAGTATSSPTAIFTATRTNTALLTATFTATNSATETSTATPLPVFTNTPVNSPTRTSTLSPTAIFTVTQTNTVTTTSTSAFTSTATYTPTSTFTSNLTPTHTLTSTAIWTNTSTNTFTPSFTRTPTLTLTFTPTPTYTLTPISTLSFTPTPTFTFTAIWTNSPTFTPTSTYTPVPVFTPHLSATPTAALTLPSPVVYPNPAKSSVVTLQLPMENAKDVTVQIFTVAFREVQTVTAAQLMGNHMTLALVDKTGTSLADGLYYFVIQANGQRWVTKVLVLR